MKIISCHIENFGKLHDVSFDFSDGNNVICEDNGWGKSTFAVFIKTMFYGLSGDRKRTLDNERKRFAPWQGGVFGGKLQFETDDKCYEITRVFKDKEVNDQFELRNAKTNIICEDYSEKIGEEIFGISADSFIRTVFIGQDEMRAKAMDDINSKIGNITDNTNDLNSFEAAQERLTKYINELNPKRSTGTISKRKDSITKLERFVKDGENILDSMDEINSKLSLVQEKYDELKAVKKEALDKQKKLSDAGKIIAKKGEWERLKKNCAEKEIPYNQAKNKFKGDIPTKTEVDKADSACDLWEKSRERKKAYVLTEEESTEYNRIVRMFDEGNCVPSDGDINQMVKEVATLNKYTEEMAGLQLSERDNRRLTELEDEFAGDKSTVSEINAIWNERNGKKASILTNKATLQVLESSGKISSKSQEKSTSLIILFTGLIGIIAGIGVAVAVSVAAGAILLALAVAAVAFGIIKGKKVSELPDDEGNEISMRKSEIEKDESYVQKAEEEVKTFLSNHNKEYDENTVSVLLAKITEAYVELKSLKEKAALLSENDKTHQIENIRTRVQEYIKQFDNAEIVDDHALTGKLYDIKNDLKKYNDYLARDNKAKEIDGEIIMHKKSLDAFFEKYGFETDENTGGKEKINIIRKNVFDYENASANFKEAKDTLARFEENVDVDMFDKVQLSDAESLEDISNDIVKMDEETDVLQKNISDYNKMLDDIREKYDEWEETKEELNELYEIQDAESKKHKYLKMALEKLQVAKETLTAKYSAPILNAFKMYYELLCSDSDNAIAMDAFRLDANINVLIDEMGMQRNVENMSTGYKDLIDICLRLALVDAMYEDEKPVLIFDDPFTNMDDSKVKAARRFLEHVAARYQIIYFTCSKERA